MGMAMHRPRPPRPLTGGARNAGSGRDRRVAGINMKVCAAALCSPRCITGGDNAATPSSCVTGYA